MEKEHKRRDPALPPEHIGQIDPGYSRNEEIVKRGDALEEEIALQAEDPDGLQAIDPAKLNGAIDNEVGRLIGRSGKINVSGQRNDRFYCFVPHAQDFQGAARSNVRTMHATMQEAGWEYVNHDDPEGRELIGNDCASGTNLRGWADTVMMWISKERMAVQDAKMARKQGVAGAIEEQIQALGANRGVRVDALTGRVGPGASPTAQQIWGREQPEIIVANSKYGDRVLRDGTIPGAPAPRG